MLPADREWFAAPGATLGALDSLKRIVSFDLPEAYLRFLAFSNGGEGSLPVEPFNLCLDSAETVVQNATDRTFEEFFPGLFVIGGNGGGEAIAFDLRTPQQFSLVYFDMTNANIAESVRPLASSFDRLIDLIGRSE